VNLDADKVKRFQRAVGATADGIFGPATLNLGLAYIAAHGGTEAPEPPAPAQPPTGLADPRSEATIATLHPQVQQPFRDLLRAINAAVAPAVGKWISGYRGEAEQNALYAKGRTAPGPRVTSARWPTSSHNGGGGTTGFACDIGFFSSDGTYIDEGPQYDVAGKLARAAGFNWGADFGDRPHICLRPPSLRGVGESTFIRELIHRVKNGLAVWP
jgi:peptidoglycan L-alanyl-D-glutamate endopeptidase CwlK